MGTAGLCWGTHVIKERDSPAPDSCDLFISALLLFGVIQIPGEVWPGVDQMCPGQGWQTGSPTGQGLSSGRHPRLTLASTHCIFKSLLAYRIQPARPFSPYRVLATPVSPVQGDTSVPSFPTHFSLVSKNLKENTDHGLWESRWCHLVIDLPRGHTEDRVPISKEKCCQLPSAVVCFSSFIMAWDKILCH